MAHETTLTVRCRPFSGYPTAEHRVSVDDSGVVRVYDAVAGHYTTVHSLSARTQRRIRHAASESCATIRTTRTYEIYENGHCFARLEARTASSALRRAARAYPRVASDYNLESGDKCTVTWRACLPGGRWEASADVPVPSRGDRAVSVHEA